MIAKVWTAKFGVKSSDKITIEIAKTSTSLPRISLLGIPASEAIASKERVLTACRQAGIRFPHAKITINLHSQAKIAKSSGLEFAIAVGLMQIHDLIPKDKYQVLGGLSLDGNIEPVEGHYSALQSLAENSKLPVWVSPTYLPVDCQAAWSRNLRIVNDITEFLACATGKQKPTKFSFGGYELMSPKYEQLPQMVSPGLANCLQLVLSGGHHCLLLGAPGVGKTHAKLILSALMPALSPASALQRQLTLNISNWSPGNQRLMAPAPSITRTALLGSQHQRGLIDSLTHSILFLDELPSWRRECLASLRPLLDPDRLSAQVEKNDYALSDEESNNNFCCVATANPCPCGFWGLPQCQCMPADVERYLQRFSGALRDRFDITWRVSDLDSQLFKHEDWQNYYQAILAARQRQRERIKNGFPTYARLYSWPQLRSLAPKKINQLLGTAKKTNFMA